MEANLFQKRMLIRTATVVLSLAGVAGTAYAKDEGDRCSSLPGHSALKMALDSATSTETSGLNNQMWATVVDRDGVVCAVAFSGVNRGAQWPGSRVISAQKANTANAFSLMHRPTAVAGTNPPAWHCRLPIHIRPCSRGQPRMVCRPATLSM
jgi:hypothetical protein